jgi:hypothetical protein
VVFPWILDEIVSGKPKLLKPYVVSAREAAEKRNHYWRVDRGVAGPDGAIVTASHTLPYPNKANQANDQAVNDAGNNFGRFARSGLMKSFITAMMSQPVAGIPLGAWQQFIKIFADGKSPEKIDADLRKVAAAFTRQGSEPTERAEAIDEFISSVKRLVSSI